MRTIPLNFVIYPKINLTPHNTTINTVKWSPDGKRLASGSADNTIKIFDIESGKEVQEFTGHQGSISDLSWNPDGKKLASAAKDKTIKIWDLEKNQEIDSIPGHDNGQMYIKWSPNGEYLATDNTYNSIIIFTKDIQTVHVLEEHEQIITCIVWSPDSKYIATGSFDCSIKIWDIETGSVIKTLSDHTKGILTIAWNSNGKVLISGAMDKTIKMWDVETGKLLKNLTDHGDDVNYLTWRSDSQYFVSCSADCTLKIWDANTTQAIISFSEYDNLKKFYAIDWSPDGTYLASCISREKSIRVWRIGTEREVITLYGNKGGVNHIAWSKDGKRIASAHDETTVLIWDTETRKVIKSFQGTHYDITSVSWSPDGSKIASDMPTSYAKVWEVSTGNELFNLSGHTDAVTSVAWSPNGNFLATGSADKAIIIWDVNTGNEIKRLSGHEYGVNDVSWNNDGNLIASCSNDQQIIIWNIQSGTRIKTLKGHTSYITSVAWSKDGKTLASSSGDKSIKIWDAQAGTLKYEFIGHEDAVKSLAWCSDGIRLASTSSDNTIRIWDTKIRRELLIIKGHTSAINSVAWSPDGKEIATASSDYRINIWDVNPNMEFLKIAYLSGEITWQEYLDNKENEVSSLWTMTEQLFKEKNINKLGQIGFLPTLLQYTNNADFQKDFSISLRSSPENVTVFWKFLKDRGILNKASLNWSIKIYQLPSKDAVDQRMGIMELIKEQSGRLINRNETVIHLQVVIEGLPAFTESLIKSIIIDLETDRGDIHQLKFADFYFRDHPSKKYPEYQDTITFKIDPGYNTESEAILYFNNIEIEYEDPLIPRKSSRIERLIEKTGSILDNLLILNDLEPEFSDLVLQLGRSSDPDEWCNFFDLVKDSFREPNIPAFKLKIPGVIGKWAEYLLAGLVLAGSFPGLIQFGIRWMFQMDQIPILWELLSYLPVTIILIYLTIRFGLQQRSSKGE